MSGTILTRAEIVAAFSRHNENLAQTCRELSISKHTLHRELIAARQESKLSHKAGDLWQEFAELGE